MAGKFIVANYERDDGTNGAIRVQPETVTAWNAQATGSRVGLYVRARGSKRSYGLVARSVTLTRSIGSGEAYNAATVSIRVPVFTKAAWAALAAGQTVTYQGVSDWVVAGTNGEESR